MTSRDIADALAAAQKSGEAEARERIAFVLETMAEGIAAGDVALAGFGRLVTSLRQSRTGDCPTEGEVIIIGFWTRADPESVRRRPGRVAGCPR